MSLTSVGLCAIKQGCQMVCFQTKNTNLGKFWRALYWKMLLYFMVIWNILWTYGIFMAIWYILCSFGTLYPVLVKCTKKNLASLPSSPIRAIDCKTLSYLRSRNVKADDALQVLHEFLLDVINYICMYNVKLPNSWRKFLDDFLIV
jgi:hypothetical protein